MIWSSPLIVTLVAVVACQSFAEAWMSQAAAGTTRTAACVERFTLTSRLFSTVNDKKGEKNHPSGGSDSRIHNRKKGDPNAVGSNGASFESDLEESRNALEELMMKMYADDGSGTKRTTAEMNRHRDYTSSPVAVMTSAGRRRRQLEMDLLRQLRTDYDIDDCGALAGPVAVDGNTGMKQFLQDDDNDEHTPLSSTLDELMHLWMYEHGPEPAAQLEAMQRVCSPGMAVEEAQLRDMMKQYPTWAEPRARLAILLFMKGISDESRNVALEALQLKPWHFDVYPILIMISLRKNNVGEALYWARQSLPTYRPNSAGNRNRRKDWVTRALVQASEQWELAEWATLDQQQQLMKGVQGSDCWE